MWPENQEIAWGTRKENCYLTKKMLSMARANESFRAAPVERHAGSGAIPEKGAGERESERKSLNRCCPEKKTKKDRPLQSTCLLQSRKDNPVRRGGMYAGVQGD